MDALALASAAGEVVAGCIRSGDFVGAFFLFLLGRPFDFIGSGIFVGGDCELDISCVIGCHVHVAIALPLPLSSVTNF